jgi:multidrug efflux pump subunit AcrA (membrane-fusion protein)
MVELELPNPDNAILPGTFAQVVLTARKIEPAWIVPAGVLLTRSDGLRVAVVEQGDTVRLCKVVLGRDYGGNIEVISGLKGDERLVINPPDTMADREHVTVADKDSPKTKGPPVAVSDGHKTRS